MVNNMLKGPNSSFGSHKEDVMQWECIAENEMQHEALQVQM